MLRAYSNDSFWALLRMTRMPRSTVVLPLPATASMAERIERWFSISMAMWLRMFNCSSDHRLSLWSHSLTQRWLSVCWFSAICGMVHTSGLHHPHPAVYMNPRTKTDGLRGIWRGGDFGSFWVLKIARSAPPHFHHFHQSSKGIIHGEKGG